MPQRPAVSRAFLLDPCFFTSWEGPGRAPPTLVAAGDRIVRRLRYPTQNPSRANAPWIVLGQDGRHVSLGRTVPADEEIAAASEALPAQGLGGWLVAMDSTYSGRGRVMLAQLHTIGAAADLDWPVAVTAFLDARQRALRMWSFD